MKRSGLVFAARLGSANGQVTYAGHLLYFFAGDHAAGHTNGVGCACRTRTMGKEMP